MDTVHPILVAYDGSPDAELALRWAGEEARATGTGLRVMVVDDVVTSPWGLAVAHHGEEVLAGAGAALTDVMPEAVLETRVGHVMEELLNASESASMVVVGSRGHGRTEDLLIGSVSQHLARHATCPVAVVRPAHTAGSRRIVVGIDGSKTSSEALEYACRRAERTGESVTAIHAWHEHVPSTDVWSSEPRVVDSMPHRQVLLAESVAGVRTDHPDVVLEQEAVPVAPVRCLADASRNASLLVVGSHGLGFFGGLLLGSVSQGVLHRAECPVVVVR
ncbi:universal stress protein [Nocardioides ganghwensis]|jgi:nucleotide-binding universal stress UspA family protein|uniref:Universal stress protein n=1 Tax=Nocardioides ganghwensis TaxID=252230 RepID=A0A4Q2SAZ1_9ACTN|nr:universal stress protein [Nocardioides ganghwensis]MBD3945739.1 universal stress protein [Nocardioides ganghwensis]RYC01141.1 universal stress protein [Nocardioides ganghwensis]